jgi:protein-S-isoprenylcysteine O-methyltransferase Ste14
MALQQELETQGNWLFRYRGVLPFLFVPLVIIALFQAPHSPLDKEPYETIWLCFCVAISLMGILWRVLVIGYVPSDTSGRNTTAQRASELNTSGMYSVVRHPLYVGNFLMALGLVASVKVAWLALSFCLIYALYYERIMIAEEGFLRKKFGDAYNQWAENTPAFMPRLSQWRAPNLYFSWRMVLRREYPGVLVVISGFLLLEIGEEALIEHEAMHRGVIDLFIVGIFIVSALRFLKKKTDILLTPDR